MKKILFTISLFLILISTSQAANLTQYKFTSTDNLYSTSQNIDLSSVKSKLITKLVRSGERIVNNGDILVFNRVNSGAEIDSQNNICIFGECSGDVKCEGEFLILSKIIKGKVMFQGEIITPNMLKYKLNLIYKENNNLNIKDILSL